MFPSETHFFRLKRDDNGTLHFLCEMIEYVDSRGGTKEGGKKLFP